MHPRFSNFLLTTAALIALAAAPAAAGPQGPTVGGGAATVQGQGGPAVVVNQSSSSAIINWNTFNIGANESVRFNQPGSSSVVLNRVTGGLGPSEILGTLTANGRVFLINRDGILFGPSAVVNTAGFLASTHDIANADFMAGRYNFNIPGRPDASIVNQGRITATSGGFAALVAPGVRNSGTITATLGTVALASSGTGFSLDLYGDKLITLAVNDQVASKVIDVATGRPLKSLVTNDGKIRANGGRVELTAAAARAVVDSVINTSGVIKANSIGRHNGMIVLAAGTGASKPAGAPTQTIKISGTLSAAGKKKGTQGGTILVSGEDIKLANARIDASGRAGGGKVLIGGDWRGGNPNTSLVTNPSAKLESFAIPTATMVSVDAATTINASATGRGNGGKVVLWSDSETTFAGTVLARGGAKAGDGGFVEVSSHRLLNYSGTTDTRAPKGTVGTLLLDPENFYINANGLPPRTDPTASAISANALVNQLASNNVVLSTQPSGTHAGDIVVDAHVTWGTNSDGTPNNNSLTLSAFHDILFMSGTQVTNTGAGNLVLRADNTGTGQGTVVFDSGGHVDYTQSSGTVSIFYNPSGSEASKYQNPTNYFCPPCPGGGGVFVNVNQPSQLTAYMLVNTASDLDALRTNLSGTYALGRDINAGSISNFTPIPNFAGLFDGNGGLGVNYTISNLTIASTSQNVGLFSSIGSTGVVRNLNLADATVSGLTSQFVGTLAGANAGTISNVSATDVAVIVGSNGNAGGLVGLNSGTITNASASGDVAGAAGINGFTTLGGLAAVNLGSISNSSASVAVGSPSVANLQAGGLVGSNSGTILSSVALGNVQAGDASIAGGLIASNSVTGAITGSQASGNVTVAAASLAGGLAGTNAGAVTDSVASGAVSSTGSNSTIGGLAGGSTGTITASVASGAVTSTGANSTVGGLVGTSAGVITASSTTGAVSSTGDNSVVGGLVGDNTGAITDSTASGAVNSSGANSTVGALFGTNTGTITNSTGSGVVISTGANSIVNGLPNSPTIPPGCIDPLCGFANTGILPPPASTSQLLPPFSADLLASLSSPVLVINNLAGQGPTQFAALNPAGPSLFSTVEGGIRLPQQQPPGQTGSQQGQQQQLPTGFDRRVIDIPPPTETRFVNDEVVLQIAGSVTVERLEAAVGRLGLTLLAYENLAITGSTVVRFRIADGRSPAEVIPALAAIQLVAVAQPNYVYTLQQQPSNPVPASRGDATQGDPAQYMLEKLKISDVHRMVRGTDVPIAVIDSEIDVTHPELEGAVTKSFDAVGAPENSHAHGTGMAGAIAAHRRLLGTAPAARLLAVHAFSSTAAITESTTFNILKGINWSVQEGARIINMSFAGPRDASLARALKAAYDKGIVLIAAAGNGGPKSPPLFPGADPYVIAVTATDVDDKLFTRANRGKYISVAAPGVDILVPAPEGDYQITTGTSVAAAEVSGIVALLLERNPKLTPADIRRILTASAKRLAPGERDDNFGSGLIDPMQALQLADPRIATTTPARQR
jgi:filamentous hemagglutinin family protein